MGKSLDFKNNLEVLTLDELKLTQKEDEVGNTSRARLRHYDLITELADKMVKRNMKFEIDPIYVRKGGPSTAPNASVYPYLEEKWGKNALEAHVIRKLVTRINITDLQDKETQASIGIGFNQHGIIVAFGQNVFVCSNMSIWGENVLSNYGSSKITNKELFSRYTDWMDAFQNKRQTDLNIIRHLKETEASQDAIPYLIGEMQMSAVKQAYLKGDVAPFNISQITDFTKSYLKRLEHDDKLDIHNMWDIYNIGTRLLRAKDVRDLEPIYHQNQVFGNFLCNRNGIVVTST